MHDKMGNAPLLKLIINMSLPAMFSMIISALYNIVDSIFVAQLGEYALTAVSLAFPIQTFIIAVAVGTGVGLNSLISRRLGEKNVSEASDTANHGIVLGLLNGLVFAILGILFTKTFFELFTEDPLVFKNGCIYNYIVTIFSFGIFVQINAEKIIQSTGNMFYPMCAGLIGAVINIILDPIFIFGYFGITPMGVMGAAIATVIGQIIAMCFLVYILLKRNHGLHIRFRHFKVNLRLVKEIYTVGFPSIIMQSISAVLIMFLNKILIGFSSAAVSVLGIYFKLQSFVFMPVFGIVQGVMPIMGYNYGAGNKKRLTDTVKISMALSGIVMILGTAIFWIFTEPLIGFFNPTPEMLSIGRIALRIISINFISAAGGIIISTLFQASGFGNLSLLISILRQVVIILPLSYFLGHFYGLSALWFAFPLSDLISFLVSLAVYLKVYQEKLDLKVIPSFK